MKIKYIALIALIISGFYLWIRNQNKKIQEQKFIISMLNSAPENRSEIVERFQDKDSINHAVIKENIVKTPAEKKSVVGSGYIDSVTRALKVSIGKINELTKINAQLSAAIKLNIQDPLPGSAISSKVYKDKFLDLVYYPDKDSVFLNYNIQLSAIKYSKKKWFLGSRINYIDFFSQDPRVKIANVSRFQEATKVPGRFGISIFAGYGFQANKLNPVFGAGLSYNIIRF